MESFPFKVERKLQSEVLLLVSDVVSAMELCDEFPAGSSIGGGADRLAANDAACYQTC